MNRIGEPFIELPSVDSTNIYAMQQVHARLAKPGTVFFAHEQTAGKGQRGKGWFSEAGENLTLSAVIAAPNPDPGNQFALSCATALACHDFFKVFAGDETAIKWPNDIYWNDRKAGGILIENVIKAGVWEFAVIGIGMNINQVIFNPSLPNPVSLKQITGKNFNIIEMARQLCNSLDKRIRMLIKSDGNPFVPDYNSNLYKRNELVTFKKGDEILEALVRGVNAAGKLIIDDEEEMILEHGTFEWCIPVKNPT